MATHSGILAWKIHGQRSLEGYSPLAHKMSETTEHKEHCYCYCSASQSCLTFCDPKDCSTLGLPVSHHLLKFVQVHVLVMSSSQLVLWYHFLLLPSILFGPISSVLLDIYHLLFVLYLFEAMEIILYKKQIWVIFLFKCKMGHKAAETIHNLNNAFDPGM